MSAKKFITNLLAEAGIEVNGSNPWDIEVRDERFYRGVLVYGSLGLGESFMDGWWHCRSMDLFFEMILRAKLDKKLTFAQIVAVGPHVLLAKMRDYGSRALSGNIASHHYGIGNDLYEAMLGPTMAYTCGYHRHGSNLNLAQKEKFDLVCRKLGFRRDQAIHVLDIGCGWGGFLKYAAERYGVSGIGVTVTREQVEFGNAACAKLPVMFEHKDYREVKGMFDAVVSIGMCEHVGRKYYRTFMEKARSCLRDEGLFLLHTIGSHDSKAAMDPWAYKYIFPGGEIPTLERITRAIKGLFVIEDMHNFGHDYYHTLMAWHANFIAAWPVLKRTGKYDERFRRMWGYYLLSCAGAFKARRLHLWQFVLSPEGVRNGYRSVR